MDDLIWLGLVVSIVVIVAKHRSQRLRDEVDRQRSELERFWRRRQE